MTRSKDATILIVEDEEALRRGLSDSFRGKGYTVIAAADGPAGLDAALDQRPDLILLDLMLPGMNGYEICQTLREEGLDMPILMLTAKDQESDIVLGLNIGADDYVTKPFSIRELHARVAAILRRRQTESTDIYTFGEFTLDITSRRLLRGDDPIELTPKEFEVLALLVKRAGRALTRRAILTGCWGYSVFVTERSVDRCITTLRGKIEPDPRKPIYIQTVREVGYRFELNGE